MEGPEANRSERHLIPTVSEVLDDGTIVELVYQPVQRKTQFAVFRDGAWTLDDWIDLPSGHRLVPFSPDNNLIKNEVVLLPSAPLEYDNERELISTLQRFIHRYIDVSPAFERVATYYVLLTWLYDAFNEVPYLRLRGDFGTGKTRALLTIGSLCYKAFFASGASTVSPIFHTLDAFRGTLIFDEADFRFSDERSQIVKVLNNGNVRGMPVLRTMMNRQKEFNPQAFQVFGPKIAATRGSYDDKGLESRFLTEEMGGRRLRDDVPINLPPTFKEEARQLRNQLLLYRFHRRLDVRLDSNLADPQLEPRLNQILMPLLSIIDDPTLRTELKGVALDAYAGLVGERSLLAEAHVLEILGGLMDTGTHAAVPIRDIAAGVVEKYSSEYERPITNRWIGGILRKRLNLRSYKSHGVYIVPASERSKVLLLCERFGVELNGILGIASKPTDREERVELGDVGTSGTA